MVHSSQELPGRSQNLQPSLVTIQHQNQTVSSHLPALPTVTAPAQNPVAPSAHAQKHQFAPFHIPFPLQDDGPPSLPNPSPTCSSPHTQRVEPSDANHTSASNASRAINDSLHLLQQAKSMHHAALLQAAISSSGHFLHNMKTLFNEAKWLYPLPPSLLHPYVFFGVIPASTSS